MVMTTSWTMSSRATDPGDLYSGVVYVSNRQENAAGTGALLYDGRAILTAAHVVNNASGSDIEVRFETARGAVWRKAKQVIVDPDYDPDNSLHDTALIILERPAPVGTERYQPYRKNDELGKNFTLIGYGNIGAGATGETAQSTPERHFAENTFDTTATQLKQLTGYLMGWSPHDDLTLLADFDDGTTTHDALGRLANIPHTGVGEWEGTIAAGDSGGPALIDGKIAGIASYGASLSSSTATPDVTPYTVDASFGEIAGWTRVSMEQAFIDQTLRRSWTDAPQTPDQVVKHVQEGEAGAVSTAWFLVQYSSPVTDEQPVKVKYKTIDGTAMAGEDYIPVEGTLLFYPGENAIPIPVEIIGDDQPEPDETFSLVLYDPTGGSFPFQLTELVATRTIIDDDGWTV